MIKQAQVLGQVHKPKQLPSQQNCQHYQHFSWYIQLDLVEYCLVHCQEQLKGCAMQGSVVLESETRDQIIIKRELTVSKDY